MQLHNNKILITGATSGIGKALTEKFIALENNVIAIGRDEKKLAELAKTSDRILPFCCDVSKLEELHKLAAFIKQYHTDLNTLINNAGIQYNYNFTDGSELFQKIENEVNTNFAAPLHLVALLLPILDQNQNASIINISSALAIAPKKQAPVYCGTKAGIHIFSKSLRYQLKKVKVFDIIPPLVDTKMTQGRGKKKMSAQALATAIVKAYQSNTYEVHVGKAKLLQFIYRISPMLAFRIMRGQD